MADYLSRNLILLKEAEQIVQPIRLSSEIVGSGTRNWFVLCGDFQSTSQGQTVYTGVKFSDRENLMDEFYTSLTNIALIDKNHPEIVYQLPLFYGLVTTPRNKPKAVVTQDFSAGGQKPVEEYREFPLANIPDGLVELFDPFGNSMIQLEKAIFYVDGERKIGDLNHLHPKEKYKSQWGQLKEKISSENHTIPFKRVPLEEFLPNETERRYADLVLGR